MACPRVGHINFLNVLPLTYSYVHGGSQGLYLTAGVPAVLNSDLVNGRLDVSAVSSIVYARHSEELLVLPDICIRSDGTVESLIFVARRPIETFAASDKIILTAKSATTHCLLKIIMKKAYGAAPHYHIRHIGPENPLPDDATGALLIGDDALYLHHHREKNLFYYDIGAEWKKLTGRPMVYAVWAVNRRFAAEEPEMLQLAYDRITKGMRNGYAKKAQAINSILAQKPFTFEQLDKYLEVIRWDLGPKHIAALETFYALAQEMGLIKEKPAIEFAPVRRGV